jgi:methionyl-tRNA formyltransferase
VKAAAVDLGLPVTHDMGPVTEVGADLGVVVAFGRIIKPDVLAALDMVNIHFSLLPRWRGAAPVERAILAGDERTGVCLMAVEEGLDTGGVYRRQEVTIGVGETARQLTARLADIGAQMLVSALDEGLGPPVAQSGEPTYAAKVEPDDLRLDWSRPAEELARVVRVGRAWTTYRGKRVLILDAVPADSAADPAAVAAGSGSLLLRTVQPEGKRAMAAGDWLRGLGGAPAFD